MTSVKMPRGPTPAASVCPALQLVSARSSLAPCPSLAGSLRTAGADLAADLKGCRSGRAPDESSGTLLVLALGNPLLGDEGVGPRALEALASAPGVPPSVVLLDGGTSGLSLVPRLHSAERVLVLDAVSTGRPPGTVVRLDGRDLKRETFGATSVHQLGLGDVLFASRLSGGPEEVVVLGVEPESLGLGVGLSAPVENAVGTLVAVALRQLREWEGLECTSSP